VWRDGSHPRHLSACSRHFFPPTLVLAISAHLTMGLCKKNVNHSPKLIFTVPPQNQYWFSTPVTLLICRRPATIPFSIISGVYWSEIHFPSLYPSVNNNNPSFLAPFSPPPPQIFFLLPYIFIFFLLKAIFAKCRGRGEEEGGVGLDYKWSRQTSAGVAQTSSTFCSKRRLLKYSKYPTNISKSSVLYYRRQENE
jgi:hypothetical protein